MSVHDVSGMSANLERVTALVVNYRTPDYTRACVDSFLRTYPQVRMLLVDNGSQDESTSTIVQIAAQHKNVECLLNEENLNHGPAMHQGLQAIETPYAFTLDSDTEVLKAGFLELMLRRFENPDLYAIGSLSHKNRYGFNVQHKAKKFVRYINPHAMLLEREKYFNLPPFFHHGAPCIHNMQAVERTGWMVEDFPVHEYIYHLGRGTCSRYGYGLSPKTFIQGILFDRIPRFWAQLRKGG